MYKCVQHTARMNDVVAFVIEPCSCVNEFAKRIHSHGQCVKLLSISPRSDKKHKTKQSSSNFSQKDLKKGGQCGHVTYRQNVYLPYTTIHSFATSIIIMSTIKMFKVYVSISFVRKSEIPKTCHNNMSIEGKSKSISNSGETRREGDLSPRAKIIAACLGHINT